MQIKSETNVQIGANKRAPNRCVCVCPGVMCVCVCASVSSGVVCGWLADAVRLFTRRSSSP